jgi:hypothetical protein
LNVLPLLPSSAPTAAGLLARVSSSVSKLALFPWLPVKFIANTPGVRNAQTTSATIRSDRIFDISLSSLTWHPNATVLGDGALTRLVSHGKPLIVSTEIVHLRHVIPLSLGFYSLYCVARRPAIACRELASGFAF